MVKYLRAPTLLLTCLFLPGTSRGQDVPASSNSAPASEIKPFFEEHCFDCHDADKPEGDLNLEELSKSPLDLKSGPLWATILKRIETGEMPPKKKKRPAEEELRKAVAWLTSGLDQAETAFRAKEKRADFRRFTRLEYRNTLRDLIGHPYDSTDLLSPDPVSHGFDNVGESLVVSPFHVENFVKATDRLLDKVINIPDQPPQRQHWRIVNSTGEKKPLQRDNGSWHDGHRGKKKEKIKPGLLQGNVLANSEIPNGATPYKMVDLAQDPPVEYEGAWDIRCYGASATDEGVLIRDEDNVFGFKWFAYEEGTYRIRIHLSTFGPGDWKGLPPKLQILRDPEGTLWQERLLDLNQSHTVAIDLYRDNIPWYVETSGNRFWGLKLYYVLTQEKGGDGNPVPFGLHISNIEVEGPYHPQWPPAWHKRVFPEKLADEQDDAYAKRVLATFMKRAYRRPVSEDEVTRMVEIYQKQRATGLVLKKALRMPLASILSSPSFLYYGARPDAVPGQEAWEMASRLSYFLWRTMPDDRLMELAQSGELLKPATITAEIQRMLKDPKAETLIEHFTSQWLGLDKLSKLTVDGILYPSYDLALREAMVGEANAFFREILQNDLSIYQFINSDFLMLNERIAKHYGIEGVKGTNFRKVPIDANHPRGGVMTQAGVLTATANGLRTLPITRGAFVLEQILADPPKPPPPDVPAVDKVVTAKPVATLRERLEQHRNDPSCINCHEKIDPPGFALESFDAIGTWRSQELVEVERNKQENQVFAPGEVITIHFANGTGEGSDKIAVLPAAETDNKQFEKLDSWKFTTDTRKQLPNGLFNGIITLNAPKEPGEYEARYFLAGRLETAAASQRFKVAADGSSNRKAPLLLDAGNQTKALAWAPVDATGTFPDGRSFKDIREFKSHLMQNKTALLKSLTEKMLIYATGNTVSFGDRTTVNTIVKKLEQTPTLRTLVEQIVLSDRFLERPPQP